MLVRTLLFGVVAAFIVAVLLVPPALADDRDQVLWGRMTVEGVITSVNPGGSTFLLRVMRPERPRRLGLGYVSVWVQQGTRIEGNDDPRFERPWFRTFRPGDRVQVDGFRLDDGRLLALQVEVRDRAFASAPVVVSGVTFRGVIIARGANLIVIVDVGGTTRIILISAGTRVRGLRASFGALQANDTVVIVGEANADGSVAAREVQVIQASR